ncbi:MAG: chromate efflux transporter [Nitrosomonadales bacterium]|nr:chromate efflux transporter [Nitrosomonadales bacterium]
MDSCQFIPEAILNTERVSLWTLFTLFLRIGSTAFGGFMALIAVVENHVVERRKWLTHEDMLDGVSLATVLPGPIAVNVIAYVGHRLRGIPGALACAVGVILPAFLLMLALSAAYFAWGQIPAVGKLFMGFIPTVAAIILVAAWNMGRKTIKGIPEALIAGIAAALMVWQGSFAVSLAIIVISGTAGWLIFREKNVPAGSKPAGELKNSGKLLSVAVAPVAFAGSFLSVNSAMLVKLFMTFAGMSVFLFGGGYVFIPLMQNTVVQSTGWLTPQEFVDAIAMSQIMPGPIVLSTVFIGYKIAGLAGAVVATLGIFLPPGILMIAGTHVLNRIKQSALIKAVLRGVRPAIIGMIASAVITVAMSAQHHWVSLLIFAAALLAQLRFKLDVVWVIPTAGLAGLLMY